jgi:hypothetical protein
MPVRRISTVSTTLLARCAHPVTTAPSDVLTLAMLRAGVPATRVKRPPSQARRQPGASAIELTTPLAPGFHDVTR